MAKKKKVLKSIEEVERLTEEAWERAKAADQGSQADLWNFLVNVEMALTWSTGELRRQIGKERGQHSPF